MVLPLKKRSKTPWSSPTFKDGYFSKHDINHKMYIDKIIIEAL